MIFCELCKYLEMREDTKKLKRFTNAKPLGSREMVELQGMNLPLMLGQVSLHQCDPRSTGRGNHRWNRLFLGQNEDRKPIGRKGDQEGRHSLALVVDIFLKIKMSKCLLSTRNSMSSLGKFQLCFLKISYPIGCLSCWRKNMQDGRSSGWESQLNVFSP